MDTGITRLSGAPDLVTVFASSCRAHAGQVAVRHGSHAVTYRQLAINAAAVAAGLGAELAARDGDPPVAAIILEPGSSLICAMLGAVTAGAAYLPLDAAMPDGYLLDVLAEARPGLIVTSPGRVRRLRAAGRAVTMADLPGSGSRPGRLRPPQPGDAAYVIFTSGTAGRPKGVVVSHAALLNSTTARVAAYGVPARIPLLHSPAFDVHTGVVFWALLSGGTIVLGDTPLTDVAATAGLIDTQQVTHLAYPASLYAPLLEHAAARHPAGMHCLECVMVGSEPWSETLVTRHAAVLPHADLYNEYGPAEACVWTSSARVWDARAGRTAPMSIGQPAPGTGYRLLDQAGAPVQPGQRGELYITGANLATGYLHQPQLTAQRFIRLPDGERAYRTGDLAELTPGGDYVFAGRADRQVKIGGVRVEPGHIETILMTHPRIVQAHVTARTGPAGNQALTAYLVPRDTSPVGGRPDTAEVRAWLAGQLPAAMVPAAWAVLPQLPVTVNGKIDDARLPGPAPQAAGGAAPPGSDLEAALARDIAAILGLPSLACDTVLASAGADSLALVRIAAMITRIHGAEVPFSSLYQARDVQAVARLVEAAGPARRPPLIPRGRGGSAPLTAQQQQIWFLTRLAPGSRAYQAHCTLRLTGPLDPALLQAALSHLVRRHEILRTTFRDSSDGVPVQEVHDPQPAAITVTDLSGLPAARRQQALRANIRAAMRQRFDPAALPLIRWHLYQLADEDWVLLQSEHHLIHDGWSAVLLLAEIRDAYAALTDGTTWQPAALPAQYRDYARWQQLWKSSGDFAAQRAWWAAQLAGAPATGVTFDPDRPRPARQSFSGACLRTGIPAETVTWIDEAWRRHQVTRFAAFLTAFALLAWRHAGQDDLVIGSALSSRRQPGTEHMLGMLVNALPLRLRITADQSPAQIAAHAMQVLLGAQDHQEFPMTEITRLPGTARDPSRNPLFQLMFAFHDSPRPSFDAGGVHGDLRIEHNGSAKNDINVICVPDPPAPCSARSHDGMSILWEYNTSLYRRATAQGLLDGFRHVLETITQHQDTPVSDLDLLSPAETGQVLTAAAGPRAPAPSGAWHAGAEPAITCRPDASAVTSGQRTLTYRDLDVLAARIETQLARHGIGPGAVVAIACGPVPEHVAACLAVLRAGAAYTCLDARDPAARTRLLLRDAQAAAIICTTATATALPSAAVPLIVADALPSDEDGQPDRPAIRAADRAFLVYTSGSSGKPKAVIATHAAAVAAAQARTAYFGTGRPVTLVTLPLPFDVAGHMIMWTLQSGGTVVLPGSQDTRDPAVVRALIQDHAVTHVNFTASWYAQFLETIPDRWQAPLQVVAVGGEPCPPHLPARHAARLPHAALHNEYGPTEATVWCAASCLYAPGQPPARRITVGGPLLNYSLYVLDERLQLVPAGSRGELYIAGPGLAEGYLGQERLTRQRFITPRTGPLAGIRLYRTGDAARLCRDGTGYAILGRLDDQVKIRGYRIETGEIRDCLTRHPAVTDAIVLADPADGTARLTAWAACADPGPGAAAALREHLARHLPAWMIPAVIIPLRSLPLTTAGKVDRARLPSPVVGAGPHGPAQPLTPAQDTLLSIIRQVLGRPGTGPDDDFFAAGGDSLQAIQVCVLAGAAGLNVAVARLYQARTVRALTARPADPSPPAARRPAGRCGPLTGIQGWFFAQDFADPGWFNQARVFEIPAGTDITALHAAVTWAIRRHDAFRTRFTRDGHSWAAVLGEIPELDYIPGHDLPAGRPGGLAGAVSELHRGLDIEHGPLWRIMLFHAPSSGQRWLAAVMHHLITDAVSWDIWRADIEAAYQDLTAGRRLPARPAPGITTAPPAAPDQAGAGYWHDLAAAPKPRPRTARTGPPATAGQLRHIRAMLSPAATGHLLRYGPPRYADATPLSVILAALRRAAAPMFSGGGELYVLLEGHGRDTAGEAAAAIGWLTTLTPVLLRDDSARLIDLAASFARQLAAVPHGGADFTWHRYHPVRSPLGGILSGLELPLITVNYLSQPAPHGTVLRPSPIPAGQAIGPRNVLPAPLHLTAAIDGGSLDIRLAYDKNVFRPAGLQAACQRLTAVLELAGQAVPLTDVPVHPEAAPHFFIHPAGGGLDCYTELARLLAPGQACYGLGHDDRDPAGSIAELAAAYLRRIRQVQPCGPYALTGWSAGAAIAWEMTRQLEHDGEPGTRLTVLDPPVPGDRGHDTSVLATHLHALLPHAEPSSLRAAAEAAAAAPAPGRLATLARHLNISVPPGGDADQINGQLAVLLRHHALLAGWQPAGHVQSLHIIRPATARGPAIPAGWAALCRAEPLVTTVPGSHATMLSGAAARKIAQLSPSAGQPHDAGAGS